MNVLNVTTLESSTYVPVNLSTAGTIAKAALTPGAKYVARTLIDFHQNGVTHKLSQRNLAQFLNMTKRTLCRHMRELRRVGFLKGGRQRWTLDIPGMLHPIQFNQTTTTHPTVVPDTPTVASPTTPTTPTTPDTPTVASPTTPETTEMASPTTPDTPLLAYPLVPPIPPSEIKPPNLASARVRAFDLDLKDLDLKRSNRVQIPSRKPNSFSIRWDKEENLIDANDHFKAEIFAEHGEYITEFFYKLSLSALSTYLSAEQNARKRRPGELPAYARNWIRTDVLKRQVAAEDRAARENKQAAEEKRAREEIREELNQPKVPTAEEIAAEEAEKVAYAAKMAAFHVKVAENRGITVECLLAGGSV